MIRWDIIDPEFLKGADLLAEHGALQGDVDDQRKSALAIEIERRGPKA